MQPDLHCWTFPKLIVGVQRLLALIFVVSEEESVVF